MERFPISAGQVVICVDGSERYGEVVGTDGERLYYLLEGEPRIEAVPSQVVEFLERADARQCPKCEWNIPIQLHEDHVARCAIEPPPPPPPPPSEAPAPPPVEEEVIEGEALEPGNYTEIENVELLGQGAQGRVWKCNARDPRGRKALIVSKEITFPSKDVEEFNKHLERVKEITQLKHTHLIRYLDYKSTTKPMLSISIIMPYYKENDLTMFIRSRREPLKEYTVCSLILQVVDALRYLHNKGVAHCDIKPDNILMFDNFDRTLLMDLDTVRRVATGGHTVVGTMEYMAPEIMTGRGYGVECDIWSLGVVFYNLLALPEFPLLPLNGQEVTLSCTDWRMDELANAVKATIQRNSKNAYSQSVIKLVCEMLDHNPKKRPTADQISFRLQGLMTQLLCGEEYL